MPLFGFSQMEIREENNKLIINDEQEIRKGDFLVINSSNSTNEIFSFIRQPYIVSLKKSIVKSSSNFSDYNDVLKSKNIIGKKLKIESWISYDNDYIITATLGYQTYKILLLKSIEFEEVVLRPKKRLKDFLTKNSH